MKRNTAISLKSEIFTRGVEDVVTRAELAEIFKSGRQLRIKLGIDATSPDLHIGHAVPLWKIRQLQEAGHKAVIILGEFTTRIGDPTGKSAARAILPPEAIKKNIASIKRKLDMILLTDAAQLELRKNSEWHGKMKEWDLLNLCAMITHARLVERDMFQERIRQGREIAMSEMLYPILQGYDSAAIRSDMTIIGSDQLFNEHMGRFFQEKFGQAPQVIVTMKILPGLDGGEKMSKSLGNYIGLTDAPQDKFGKAMRVLDSLIIPYLETYTDVPTAKVAEMEKGLIAGGNPMEAKLFFAEALVRRYHGDAAGRRERERFLKVFSKKEMPDEIPVVKVARSGAWDPAELLVAVGLAPSKSEARRLVAQKAVEIDGQLVPADAKEVRVAEGTVIRVGKRRFVKVA